MKKYFSRIAVLSLILPVFLASVLCCRSGIAQAASFSINKGQKPMAACGHCKKDAPKQETCCVKQSPADQPFKISFNTSPSASGSVHLDASLQPLSAFKTQFNLAYLDGPPGPLSDSPLYISLHNFRI